MPHALAAQRYRHDESGGSKSCCSRVWRCAPYTRVLDAVRLPAQSNIYYKYTCFRAGALVRTSQSAAALCWQPCPNVPNMPIQRYRGPQPVPAATTPQLQASTPPRHDRKLFDRSICWPEGASCIRSGTQGHRLQVPGTVPAPSGPPSFTPSLGQRGNAPNDLPAFRFIVYEMPAL